MSRIQDFIKHRRYLISVSEHTIRWHTCALKRLPNENPTEQQLQQMVIRMRERALKETGYNAVIRSVNAVPELPELGRITAQAKATS